MKDFAHYKGREQTAVKHEIFGHYFLDFACIVGGQWESITYVDCFSGPWKQASTDFSDTSFGIAIKHLREAREAVRKQKGRDLKLRCYFVEKDPAAYERLEAHAARHRAPELEIVTYRGEFEAAIPNIVQYVNKGGQHTFPFFFIDPTGWTGFAMDRLSPIFQLNKVEVMVNFMTAFIHRFGKTDESVVDLFGLDVRPKLAGLSGIDLEDAAVAAYTSELRRRGKFDYVVPAIVLKSGDDRTHFHIVYATRHRRGLEVFKRAEKSAVKVMNELRAGVKVERKEAGQELLFAAAESAPETLSHVRTLGARYLDAARARVRNLLLSKIDTPYESAWDLAVQSPLVWDTDLKDWIEEWKMKGQLEIPTLKIRQRVPKLNEGHILRRTGSILD